MISGDLLKEARRRAGLSPAELAHRAGRPTSVIGRWERNEVKPSLETLRSLVRACGLELGFRLEPKDDAQDATILAALELTPDERLAQLEASTDFLHEARANLRA